MLGKAIICAAAVLALGQQLVDRSLDTDQRPVSLDPLAVWHLDLEVDRQEFGQVGADRGAVLCPTSVRTVCHHPDRHRRWLRRGGRRAEERHQAQRRCDQTTSVHWGPIIPSPGASRHAQKIQVREAPCYPERDTGSGPLCDEREQEDRDEQSGEYDT